MGRGIWETSLQFEWTQVYTELFISLHIEESGEKKLVSLSASR